MTEFSANLGFLWRELPLVDAIHAAANAGFAAVECHWPYDIDPTAVRQALGDTGLVMQSINTRVGAPGEFGLAAMVGREAEARAAIDEAVAYAAAIGARNVHLMAGIAAGAAAMDCFVENCRYASAHASQASATAAGADIGIVIEPINQHDVPGYFLHDFASALAVLDTVGAANLHLMFDCYHAGRMGVDVIAMLETCYAHIGHIQIAAVPDRGAPDHGNLGYGPVFAALSKWGYAQPLGAEYTPANGDTNASLGWLRAARGIATKECG